MGKHFTFRSFGKKATPTLKRRHVFICAFIFIVAIMFLFPLLRKADNSQQASRQSISPGKIPPAPPLHKVKPSAPTVQVTKQMSATQTVTSSQTLHYDIKQDFETNLERLRRFCYEHNADADLDVLIASFVDAAIRKSKDHFDTIQKALERNDGRPIYRNILLACLISANAPVETKATIVWDIATNQDENPSVRRTATYLTGQIPSETKRPEAYHNLLTDTDEQVVVFALTSTNRNVNMNEQNYELIKSTLINSTNINLKVAAVNAVGTAPFADSQIVLLDIVTNNQTRGIEPFSEPTLPKRSAIMLLDINNTATQQLLQTIALDDTEDPGVRAKAILKMGSSKSPETAKLLNTLLNTLDSENLVPLRAVVDTLMTDPTPTNIALIQGRIDKINDPQVQNVLLHRVNIAIKGTTP
jgi:hypothetical protein